MLEESGAPFLGEINKPPKWLRRPLYFAAETAVIGFHFGGPDRLRWFWSFTVTCPMTRSDRVPTLEEAKA